MKKFLIMLLAILLAFPCFALGESFDLSQMSDDDLRQLRDLINIELSMRDSDSTDEALLSGNLGSYYVEVLTIEKMEDNQGAPCLVVTYRYTNNSDTATTMLRTIDAKMFQNGVQLKNPTLIIGVNPNDMGLEIKPGGSIVCQKGYTLLDEVNAVDLELKLMFDTANDPTVLTITYVIDK